MKQCKNWCFTDFELKDWESISKDENIRYMCWGLEVCPKSKREHIQGWIQFHNKKRLAGVKKVCLSKSIHLEACRGDEFDNDKYCKKDGKYKSVGEFIKQGQRTDLMKIKEGIDNGERMDKLAGENFETWLKYNRGFQRYKEMVDKKKRSKFRLIDVKLFHGKTGTGKTRQAMEHEDVYKICGSQLNWWDGYDGEKRIVIDEYNNDVGITKLLNILDGYVLRLPIKGGFTYANWNEVIITTNLRTLHSKAKPEHKAALKRRITSVLKFIGNTEL